jgi:hypothetical protein
MPKELYKMITQPLLLCAGVVVGILVAPRIEHSVEAKQTAPITQTAPQTDSGPRVIVLQSYSTSGAMGSNVLLAHHLQADIAIVNGYDIMKINQQIINYLASLPVGDSKALSAIVQNSRADEIYEIPNRQQTPSNRPPGPVNK